MPMYFPDLASVARIAEDMKGQPDPAKRYTGIIPTTEAELPLARRALGHYVRTVWNDSVAAIEIEQAATKENYQETVRCGILVEMARRMGHQAWAVTRPTRVAGSAYRASEWL